MFDDLFGMEKDHKIAHGDEVVHLTTVYDVVLLGMVRGLLEDADIPYLVHERATGSAMRIMTGFSLYGTDIFVPKAAEETARSLIAGIDTDGSGAEEVIILGDDDAPEADSKGEDV